MSLLSVTVKKARFVCDEAEHFNSYVALKLQNVKSTTVTVKGANPCWEQDFLFETNDMNTGLLVEVWSKGIIWDRLLGYYFIPLSEVSYMNEEASGQWVSLDSELEMRGAEVIGTKKPTGHSLLIDCRFELPFDPENTEAADLQRKLEMLNKMMDQEARAEQTRRQILYNIGHSGYSEDSDYTSDLNYPVGGQGANSSASQFRAAANQLATPQRSLETSRENSYERDDHQIPATAGGRLAAGNYGSYGGSGHSPRYNEPYPEEGPPQRYSQSQHASESSEPLFYNSRPRHYKEYRRRKHTWDYEDSQDGWYSEGYDYHDTRISDTWGYSDTEYYPSTTSSRRRGPHRRPSLERQMTLYDDHSYYSDGYSNDGRVGKMSSTYPECETDIRYNEFYDTTTGFGYQDERYGQDDEDRQWDSGGNWYSGSTYYENKRNRKTLPQRPASSIGIHRPDYRPTVIRQRSYESEELDYSGHPTRRRKPLPQQRPTSRQEGTGKKLPPTPTKPSNVIIGRKLASLPATPSRQLPKTRTPSEESYYKSDYNEDYNYAYRSQDNLPQHTTYADTIYGDQGGYDQMPATGKTTRYPEVSQDNQYGSSYVAPAEEKYSHSYQEPQTQDTYDQTYAQNSYGEDYHQQSYAQQNTRAYQETYQDTIYPNASQPNDQYPAQPNDRYDKTTGGSVVIDDNYPPIGYEQNNVQYQDTYKQDTYQNQYTDYPVTVPSSVYDQNNVTNTFNQYPQEPYDSQYNINTSTGYQNTYQDAYPQDTYNQEKYNQETYSTDKYTQETYTQDKYNQDTYVQDKYNQEPYTQDKYNQEPYKQTTYKQEPIKQDVYQQEPYKQTTYKQEPLKPDVYQQEPYKQDVYQQEPYKQDIYQQEPYKSDTYQQEPYKQDTYQQESYKQDTYQQDSYKQDTYQQDTYQQDTYQQDTYQQDTYQQDAYQPDAYQQDAYQQDSYQQDTYQQDTYRQDTYPPDSYQQETYKQDAYKQDTYKQDGYKQDTYKQDTYKQDTYKQDTYKQDTYKQDTYKQDTYKQDTYQQDSYQQDTYNQDTYKQDTYKQDAYKQDSYKQDTYIQDTYSQDKYNQDTYGQDGGQDSYQGSFEESYKESPVPSGERRTSEVPELSVTTPRGKTRTNGYQSSESDYYYPCQESQEVSPVGMSRRKKLSKREASPLIQQNTDSLESRDDELKDSFETAVSSVSSSIAKKGYSEYSTAGDSSPAAPTLTDSPQSVAQPATTMVNHVTSNHVTSNMTVTAIVHATTTPNGKRLSRTESYQEDMLEDEEYLPEIIPKEPQRKDSQLSHQSQLSQHSSQHSQHSQHSQKPKLTRGDSYASDHFPEESYSRRSSYAQPTRKDSFSSTTQEAFKPPLTRTDSYQKRGSYSQNYTTPPPLSRTDSYQRGYFKEQESIEETEALGTVVNGEYKMREDSIERYERKEEAMIRSSRENSLADTYKTTPPLSQTDSPRGSITKQASLEESVQMDVPPRSPPEPPADNEILDIVGAAPVPTQLKERPEMTARQRWHWAYNQIIMQLNVSSFIYSPYTGILSIRPARSLVAGESYLSKMLRP